MKLLILLCVVFIALFAVFLSTFFQRGGKGNKRKKNDRRPAHAPSRRRTPAEAQRKPSSETAPDAAQKEKKTLRDWEEMELNLETGD